MRIKTLLTSLLPTLKLQNYSLLINVLANIYRYYLINIGMLNHPKLFPTYPLEINDELLKKKF